MAHRQSGRPRKLYGCIDRRDVQTDAANAKVTEITIENIRKHQVRPKLGNSPYTHKIVKVAVPSGCRWTHSSGSRSVVKVVLSLAGGRSCPCVCPRSWLWMCFCEMKIVVLIVIFIADWHGVEALSKALPTQVAFEWHWYHLPSFTFPQCNIQQRDRINFPSNNWIASSSSFCVPWMDLQAGVAKPSLMSYSGRSTTGWII